MNYGHRVTFKDLDNEGELIQWALDHCPTFSHKTITDVSDVSGTCDTIHDFFFSDEKEAMWFRLKWS